MPQVIIDPPVGPYDSVKDLSAWINRLRRMKPSPEVARAIAQAEDWIDARVKMETSTGAQ